MNPRKLFSNSDRTRIAEAVTEAERHTMGEVVPMIVRRSGHYRETAFLLGTFLGLCTQLWISLGAFWLAHPAWIVLSFIPGFLAGFFLAQWDPVLALITPQLRKSQKVRARATHEFYSHQLHETEGRTGILIFVSLMEHEAVVLADKGIHEKVPQGTWDEILARMLGQFKSGRATDGVVQAVRECGDVLSKHAPAQARNPDEIPNRLWID